MKSFYKIKQAFAPVRKGVKPKDDFRIIDSWTEYNNEEAKPKDKVLDYICFQIEAMNPETGERQKLYKAVKFIRVIRLPASAKQSTSLMEMHSSILSSLYKRETNFVCIIANVLDLGPFDEPLGLFFLYGVQGVAENITDAKRKADADMEGLIGSIIGTYRVLEAKFLDGLETEWLREKLTFMNFASVVRGIPFASDSGEDGGNKGMGGKNINPDSQGTLEEIIAGMSDYEFVLEVLASPVRHASLTAAHKRNAALMTQWYPQLQGQTNLAINISIPFMYAANSGMSNGWSHNYSNAENVGTSHGTSTNMNYGENIGQNFSNSMSESVGRNNSVSVGNTIGTSHTVGLSETEGISHNVGTSHNWGVSHNIGNSMNYGTGTSDGITQGITAGETQGMSLNQGHNIGTNQGMSHGTSLNESASTNQNFGVSNNHSLGFNEGTSYNAGRGFNESVNVGINQNQTTGFNQGVTVGENVSLSNSVGHNWGASNGGSVNSTMGRSVSDSLGYSHNAGYSQNYGYNNGESFGAGWGNTYGAAVNGGSSVSGSGAVHGGFSIAPMGVGGNGSININQGATVTNGWSENAGASFNNSYGRSSGESFGAGMNISDGVNVGRNVGQSNSISNGLNWSLNEGLSTNTGLSQGSSYSQNAGISNSASVGTSYGQGYGSSINESFGTSRGLSENVSVGNSTSLGYGSSIGFGENIGSSSGISQGISNGQGISMSDSMSNSLSRNHGISTNQSYGINESFGTNESVGVNESFGTNKSWGKNESWGENASRSQTQSVGNSYSLTNGQTVGSSWGTSKSAGSGINDSTSLGHSTSTGLGQTGSLTAGASSSMGLGPSLSYSKSHQWKNQQVEDLIEILTFKNNRLKASLREGAFYTYCYLCCPSQKALDRAMATAGSAWQNDQALAEPLQVLNLSPQEQSHILYHASAFSSDVTRETFLGEREPRYRTLLLPDELNAYTHLPRINEGGIFAEINDVPKFATPSRMQGEIYLGKIINAEHWSFERGYISPYSYRLPEQSLMHGIFTGASRSGKTVAAMRFIASLANVRRAKTNKLLRIVCLDPKRDWRGLAKYVDAERFRFYSLGNPDFHPIKLNVWKVPYGVRPQRWIDGVIDIYCRAYGLLERGKQMIADVVYYLYNEAGVFDAMNEKNWKDLVPELSAKVCFQNIYKEMEKRRDVYAGNGKAGNDTKDAYARLLERLSAFSRPYVIEHILFGTPDGMGIDDMIGDDDVTVLESEGLENTFKNFIFGVITSGFYQYAKGHEGGFKADDQYETVLVIEEANEVLTGSDTASTGKDSATLTGESPFEVLLDQSAGYGLFVMAITQKISEMPSSLIANVGLKFIGRLNVEKDITTAAYTIGLEPRYENRDFVKWLPISPIGWFICQSSRGFDFKEAAPIMVKVEQLDAPDINDEELNEILLMSELERSKKYA